MRLFCCIIHFHPIASLYTAILLADVLTASDMRMHEKRHKRNPKNLLSHEKNVAYKNKCVLFNVTALTSRPSLLCAEFVWAEFVMRWVCYRPSWPDTSKSYSVPLGSKVQYECDTLNILRATLIILRATLNHLRVTCHVK